MTVGGEDAQMLGIETDSGALFLQSEAVSLSITPYLPT